MSYKLIINLPENAFSIMRKKPEEFGRELLEAALCMWYEKGKISQSKAAEIARVSRFEFLEILKKNRVSPFQYTAEDLDQEINSLAT
jgi:predicted HTH domain antitoxin